MSYLSHEMIKKIINLKNKNNKCFKLLSIAGFNSAF